MNEAANAKPSQANHSLIVMIVADDPNLQQISKSLKANEENPLQVLFLVEGLKIMYSNNEIAIKFMQKAEAI